MGLLDQVAGQVLGSLGSQLGGGQGQSPLAGVISALIERQGGVAGLLGLLKSGGLAEQVSSWVGTGSNLPVSASQLISALGNEQVSQLAGKFGLSPENLSSGLSELLPQFIDKLTPQGEVPAQGSDLLTQGMAILGSLTQRR